MRRKPFRFRSAASEFLTVLARDVEVTVKPAARGDTEQGSGRLSVVVRSEPQAL